MEHGELDSDCVEDIQVFTVGGDYREPLAEGPDSVQQKYFIAVERPDLTLKEVLHGMLGNFYCQTDLNVRTRYACKVLVILCDIAESLQYMHTCCHLVHGNVSLENCAKYGDKWKLANVLRSQTIGEKYDVANLTSLRTAPPETFIVAHEVSTSRYDRGNKKPISTCHDMVVNPSIDTWAFGKLAFEVLVGQPLFQYDDDEDILCKSSTGSQRQEHDASSTMQQQHQQQLDGESKHQTSLLDNLARWSENTASKRENVRQRLLSFASIPSSGVDMILQCLDPNPEQRPSMDDILQHHTLWKHDLWEHVHHERYEC